MPSTRPTSDDGTLDSFARYTSVAAKVAFGTPAKVALGVTLSTSEGDYVITTKGDIANPLQSEISTYSGANEAHVFGGYVPTTGAGSGCNGTCTTLVRGFVSGLNGDSVALVYTIGTGPKAIRGAMLLY